jgi:ABC-type molybdate transport system permease subunit
MTGSTRLFVRRTADRVGAYSLPFAVQPFAAASSVDRNLIETAWSRRSRMRTFARVIVPLARPGIVVGIS